MYVMFNCGYNYSTARHAGLGKPQRNTKPADFMTSIPAHLACHCAYLPCISYRFSHIHHANYCQVCC